MVVLVRHDCEEVAAGRKQRIKVITLSSQMKAWDQLPCESGVLPTAWPSLLMPNAIPSRSITTVTVRWPRALALPSSSHGRHSGSQQYFA
jgi:hypothetical protein